MFSRGQSVAVLILLESEGETFVVLTEQVMYLYFEVKELLFFNHEGLSK